MHLRILHIALLLSVFLLFAPTGNSQTLYNTNSTPAGYGENPIGWFSLSATPDVSNVNGWWGLTDWYYPIDTPPNGDSVWVTGYSSEKSGTYLTDLIVGVEYTLSFSMSELSIYADGGWTGGTLKVGLGDENYLFPFTGGLDFGWTSQTITFSATSSSMLMSFGYEIPVSHQWNVSMDSIIFACDTLETLVSASEICLGDEVTLSALSLNDGEISWDGGIINDESFAPPAGTHIYTATSDFEGDCIGVVEIIVYEYPDFEILVEDTELCEGDSIIFWVDADGGTYEWDPAEIIIGYPYFPELGESEVALTITKGVCETTEVVEITVHEPPTVNGLVDNSTICLGEAIVFTGEGADAYTWDSGIINGEPYTPLSPGIFTYVVEGEDAISGCTSSDFVSITVFDTPTVIATADDEEVCEGDLITLTGIGASSFSWDLDITDGVAFEPPVGVTIYTVIGTDENGCQASSSIIINVIDCDPIFAEFTLPELVCLNDCISIQDATIGEVVEWDWNFGSAFEPNTSNIQNPTICAINPGVYNITLTSTSIEGATATINKELIVLATPLVKANNDTIIEFGASLDLVATSISLGDFTWTPYGEVECFDCSITNVAPNQTQTYIVELIDSNGCKGSDSVMVMVNFTVSVGVPTAFSPNNDGNNDVLYVKGNGLEAIQFSIYNRYGELIFETTDQNIGWDGTFLNQKENPGVYTWVLHCTTVDGKHSILKGNTTLFR